MKSLNIVTNLEAIRSMMGFSKTAPVKSDKRILQSFCGLLTINPIVGLFHNPSFLFNPNRLGQVTLSNLRDLGVLHWHLPPCGDYPAKAVPWEPKQGIQD